ncbi:hypothetical protein LTR01_001809 [Friedmanniomyces endolithicus]|nr:hypothetical protein LTR01_001809 [Friedmanniomyces endolithicus]KAK0830343.1 hypothetical protein LTR73_003621 [Friedmanniomyces endolithicus]
MVTPEEVFAHLRRPPSGLALDARYGVEKARVNELKTAKSAMISPPPSAAHPCPKALLLGSTYSSHESESIASPLQSPLSPGSTSSTPTSTSSDDATSTPGFAAVVEGTTRLHPTCYHNKGKSPATEKTHYTICGEKPRCREALLKPAPETGGHNFRLTNDDPLRDLCWWLGERGSRECDRDGEFVEAARFTEGHLREVTKLAYEQLRSLRGELKYLLDFAGSEGYGLAFRDTDPAVAEGLRADDLRGLDRIALLDALGEVAVEIDRAAGKIERVEGEVVKKMVELAEDGGWGARECLWRLGFCDEVDGMC